MSMSNLHSGIVDRLTGSVVASGGEDRPPHVLKADYIQDVFRVLDTRMSGMDPATRDAYVHYRDTALAQLTDCIDTLDSDDGDMGDAPEVLESLTHDTESYGNDRGLATDWDGGYWVYDTSLLLPVDVFYLRGEWDPDTDGPDTGPIEDFLRDVFSVQSSVEANGHAVLCVDTDPGSGPVEIYVNGQRVRISE